MNMKTWTFTDKTEWPRGEWDDEPDKVQWTDPATGLTCLAHRGRGGSWCGYVGVPKGHRLHGMHYDHVDVDVHGGLTYSDTCNEIHPDGSGICHVADEGEEDELYWFGFDCAHCEDIMPALLWVEEEVREKHPMPEGWEEWRHYRTLAYVKEEVGRLAMQLAVLDI